MWDQCDQRFIQFWQLILSIPKPILLTIGVVLIIWGGGPILWSIISDAFSNEVHYIGGGCCLNLASIALGSLLVWTGFT